MNSEFISDDAVVFFDYNNNITFYNNQILDDTADHGIDAWSGVKLVNNATKGDANEDPGDDGLTNLQEYQNGTNPHVADTDSDGINDGDAVENDTDPLSADSDGGGIPNLDDTFLTINNTLNIGIVVGSVVIVLLLVVLIKKKRA